MSEVTPEVLAEALGLHPTKAKEIFTQMRESENRRKVLSFRILIECRRYLEAAAALDKHMKEVSQANVAGAMVMSYSYALELAFKSLIALDWDQASYARELEPAQQDLLFGHHIPTLFDRITEGRRKKLARIFSGIAGIHTISPDELRQAIVEKAEKNFTTWRYHYESPEMITVSLNATLNLINAVFYLIAQEKDGHPTEVKGKQAP